MVSICRKPFMDIIYIYVYIYITYIYIYNAYYFRNSKKTFTALRNMMWSVFAIRFRRLHMDHSFPYPTLCDFNPISPPRRPFETKVNNSKSLGRISGKWINVLKFLLSICNWWSFNTLSHCHSSLSISDDAPPTRQALLSKTPTSHQQ